MLQFWVAMESVQLMTSLTAAVACIWGSAIGCHGVCSCCYSNDDSHRVCYLICLHVSMLRVAFLVLSLPRWLVKSVKCPPICPSVRAGPGQHFPNPNAPRRLGQVDETWHFSVDRSSMDKTSRKRNFEFRPLRRAGEMTHLDRGVIILLSPLFFFSFRTNWQWFKSSISWTK